MESYSVIKNAPVLAYVNGNVEAEYPKDFVHKGQTVSGEIETLFVTQEGGSQDMDFLKIGDNKYIRTTHVKAVKDSHLNATGTAVMKNPIGMSKPSKTLIVTALGLVGGVGYAFYKKEAYLWPVVIGGVVGTIFGMIIAHNTTSIQVGKTPTPTPSSTPSSSSGFDGKLNASGGGRVYTNAEMTVMLRTGASRHIPGSTEVMVGGLCYKFNNSVHLWKQC